MSTSQVNNFAKTQLIHRNLSKLLLNSQFLSWALKPSLRSWNCSRVDIIRQFDFWAIKRLQLEQFQNHFQASSKNIPRSCWELNRYLSTWIIHFFGLELGTACFRFLFELENLSVLHFIRIALNLFLINISNSKCIMEIKVYVGTWVHDILKVCSKYLKS